MAGFFFEFDFAIRTEIRMTDALILSTDRIFLELEAHFREHKHVLTCFIDRKAQGF